jgi:hypothetical protein
LSATSDPYIVPALELTGPRAERLRTLDAAIERLETIRSELAGFRGPEGVSPDVRSPRLDAPVWPWFAAGWVFGALFVLMFLVARALA